MLRRIIRFIVIGLVLLMAVAALLIPDRYWPAGWIPRHKPNVTE